MTPASKKQAGAELALCSCAFISPNPLSQFGSSFSGWAGLSGRKPPWSVGTWLHATSLDGWVGKQTLSLFKSPVSPASGLRRATQLQKTFPVSHICVGMSEKGSYHMGGMWRWGGWGLDIAAQCSSLLTACPASQYPSSGSCHPYTHTHTHTHTLFEKIASLVRGAWTCGEGILIFVARKTWVQIPGLCHLSAG